MGKVNFDVDAYTARLIGRENVSRLESAISELVKNTYDADANSCVLYYEDSSRTLYLADNGCGMTANVIQKHWMTIGNSSKKKNFLSAKGRVQTGAKGIGRFALDRVGDRCEMYTRSSAGTIEWCIDWTTFRDGIPLTSVSADLNEVKYSPDFFLKDAQNQEFKKFIVDNFKNTCTIFKVSPVRDVWNEKQICQIKKNLATLIPHEISPVFCLYFFEEHTLLDDARLSPSEETSDNDYHISFNVVGDNVHIEILRNEFDFKAKRQKIIKDAGFAPEDEGYFLGQKIIRNESFSALMSPRDSSIQNTIGDFSGIFIFSKISHQKLEQEKYFYKRNREGLPWKGIRIFRDNFRVRPYGDSDSSAYDWLMLSNRKAKSPAAPAHSSGKWRVRADQICGTILISRTNITLPDQANREGFVETSEFQLLKNFLLHIIQFFESDRQYVIRTLSTYYDKTHPTQHFEKEISDKAALAQKDKTALNKQFPIIDTKVDATKAQEVINQRDAHIRDLENENQLLRALATIGIITNTYVHEIRGATNTLGLKIVMAKEDLEYDQDIAGALTYLSEAIDCQKSFGSWFKVTIESIRKDRRTMKKINLKELLESLRTSWKNTCLNMPIYIDCEDIYFWCFAYEIESIFNNLIANSSAVFKSNHIEQPEIHAVVKAEHGVIYINYSDNGPGLSTKYKKDPDLILDPMESDKIDSDGETVGTGMGMWIIKNTVSDYNGSIDLSENINSKHGFHIKISLKGRHDGKS